MWLSTTGKTIYLSGRYSQWIWQLVSVVRWLVNLNTIYCTTNLGYKYAEDVWDRACQLSTSKIMLSDQLFLVHRSSEFSIRAGQSYVLKIVPTFHTYTEDFESLMLDKRGCRSNNEKMEDQDSIFKYYTQKTCIFECTLKTIIPKVASDK